MKYFPRLIPLSILKYFVLSMKDGTSIRGINACVGLEDIDVTSCLNVCIVVILLTSPPFGSRAVREMKREGARLFLLLEGKS